MKEGDLVRSLKDIAPRDAGVGLVLYTMHRHPVSEGDDGVCAAVVWFAASQVAYTLDAGGLEIVSII